MEQHHLVKQAEAAQALEAQHQQVYLRIIDKVAQVILLT
jgi:hypothetical protein